MRMIENICENTSKEISKEIFNNVFKPILDKSFIKYESLFLDDVEFMVYLEDDVSKLVNVINRSVHRYLLQEIKRFCLEHLKENYDNEIEGLQFVSIGKGNPLSALLIKRSKKKLSSIEYIELLYKKVINK